MKNDPTHVDVDDLGGSTYGLMLSVMQAALAMGRPADFFRHLERGANPNNATGGQSLVSFTMERSIDLLQRGAPKKQVETYAGATALLLHYGADLTHRPFDHNGRPAPLHNPDMWQQPVFGANVMIRALNHALDHKKALPRLDIATLDGRAAGNVGDRAADHILQAFENVGKVQQAVVERLKQPGENKAAAELRGKLPKSEYRFWWRAARTTGKPIGTLSF
jgi:hypothetical protein